MTRNVFRYDQNSDGVITFEEFVSFSLFRPTFASKTTLEKWLYKDYIETGCIKMDTHEKWKNNSLS